jgi:hypothetical protein
MVALPATADAGCFQQRGSWHVRQAHASALPLRAVQQTELAAETATVWSIHDPARRAAGARTLASVRSEIGRTCKSFASIPAAVFCAKPAGSGMEGSVVEAQRPRPLGWSPTPRRPPARASQAFGSPCSGVQEGCCGNTGGPRARTLGGDSAVLGLSLCGKDDARHADGGHEECDGQSSQGDAGPCTQHRQEALRSAGCEQVVRGRAPFERRLCRGVSGERTCGVSPCCHAAARTGVPWRARRVA